MPSGTAVVRKAWQPKAPVDAATQELFWKKVRRAAGDHWLLATSTPFIPYDGMNVALSRIAWAIVYPNTLIPQRLKRDFNKCDQVGCINPAHMFLFGKELEPVRIHEGNGNGNGCHQESELVIPRTLEAMGAIQFGLDVKPRPLRALVRPTEETLPTMEGDVRVKPDPLAINYTPDIGDIKKAPNLNGLSAQQILGLLFKPGTVVMTFKTGSVWIKSPDINIRADDAAEAILGALVLTGQHKVKG